MKTRGSWVRVVKFVGVIVVVSSVLLLGIFLGKVKRADQGGAGLPRAAANGTAGVARAQQDPARIEAYGKLPLSFEENTGQTAQEVRYVSRGAGYGLFLTPQEAVLALRTPVVHDLSPLHRLKTLQALHEASRARRTTALRMRFEGANRTARISAMDKLVKKANYFVGSDPRKWHTDVASYARVRYEDIYPGVDLVFYGNQRRLEYDFIVAPGADPKAIRLNLQGARKLRINDRGDVVLSVAGGEVVLQKPVVYQMIKGERHEIPGGYSLTKGRQVSFAVPNYDRSEPLILDPVLNYSTYLGGSLGTSLVPAGTGLDQGLGIAVDSTTGNAFVAGTTFSTDFPTTAASAVNAGPLASNPSGAVFVTEMNAAGTAEVYSTYLTGSTGDVGVALALDRSGKIYVTGQSFSSDFPTTTNALKQSPNATNVGIGTSFISKIDPALNGVASLVYSSYIGGTNGDFGNGVAVDAVGNAYVTGITFSQPGSGAAINNLLDFPVQNAFQATPSDAVDGNAFLTRIDTTKSGNASLIYSTYLGGTGTNALKVGFADQGFGVAVDGSSNAYIVGTTSSTDFPMTSPTPNGFQTTAPAAIAKGTIFLSKIDTTATGTPSLKYSTYLGGNDSEKGFAVTLGPGNVAYITGTSTSTAIPLAPAGAFQPTGNAAGVAFVGLVDTGLTGTGSLKYWSFLGGTQIDSGFGIRVDTAGNAYIVGATSSNTDFPLTPGALQPTYPGAGAVGFISKLNPNAAGTPTDPKLVYSTYFGGSGGVGSNQDQVDAIALDTTNNVFVTGETVSGNFPVFPAGAFQKNLKGTSDAFIAKLTLIPTMTIAPPPGTTLDFGTVLIGTTSAAKTITLTNNTNGNIAFTGAAKSGTNAADYTVTTAGCSPNIVVGTPCVVSITFTPTAPPAAEVATLTITDGDSTSPQNISLSGSGTNIAPDFTVTAPATATVKDGSMVNFTVTVTPVGGFNSAVALTCTGAPLLATCTPAPASVTPADGVTPVTSTVTVTTTALMVPPPSLRTPPLSIRQIVPLLLALMLLFLLPTTKRMRMRFAMATAMIFFIVLAGCSGNQAPHTPTGTFPLTITGKSGATTKTVTVNLTVN